MKFIDYSWKSYVGLPHFHKERQMQLLIPTKCYNHPDDIEFTFVPTNRIKEELYGIDVNCSKLQVEDELTAIEYESYASANIEGSTTSIQRTHELINGDYVDEYNYHSEMMVKGVYNATKFLRLHSNKINKELLLEAWNIIVDGCCDNESIRGDRFRTGNVQVGKHVGLNPLLIEEAIDSWFEFYNSDSFEDYPFLKVIILHYAFEYIHPFCDGNGRMGRLLMNNYLLSRFIDKVNAVSFSYTIAQCLPAYYLAFQESENTYSDITPFIEYLLNIMHMTFYEAVEAT